MRVRQILRIKCRFWKFGKKKRIIELSSQVDTLRFENSNLKKLVKRTNEEKTDLALSVNKSKGTFDIKLEIPEIKPAKILEKSVFVFNSNLDGFNNLAYENEELVRKYVILVNEKTDLEIALDELMRNYLRTTKRESEVQLDNIRLMSDLHKLESFLRIYSALG